MQARILGLVLALGLLSGCSSLQGIYLPAQTVALTKPAPHPRPPACVPTTTPPPYALEYLRDCTAQDSMVVFAFSGGGIRSASFGYGVLQGAHAVRMAESDGQHPLDADIDVVAGVSGGSFTAAAFANQRERLFPAPGRPDYYRDKFLTHNFFADLAAIYLAPWHWQWMFPGYGSNDEMAKIYAAIDFSSPADALFAKNFSELAMKGRPLLVVQATDFGNEQPFTFTQNDFDLICADVNAYPVGNAIAASSAFPILFSPIQLTNHHFVGPTRSGKNFCRTHRPDWVDAVLDAGEPSDLSRRYMRAQAADSYLPRRGGKPADGTRFVHLQDGGVADNIALRGLMNLLVGNIGADGAWTDQSRAVACKVGLNRLRRILIVAVDGMARPNNQVSGLPYLSDLGLILNVATSAAIDANSFETMLAADATAKALAAKLSQLDCGGEASPGVKSYFARVSFDNLDEATAFDPSACGKHEGEVCTLGDIARSDTSLDFSAAEVDALIEAGRSAFACNRKLGEFIADSGGSLSSGPTLACNKGGAAGAPVTSTRP